MVEDFNRITVEPLAGSIGAEIKGVYISESPALDVISEIRSAFLKYNVIVLRDQDITSDQYMNFAEKFGDRKAITVGLLLYAIGIFISSTASSPEAHQFLNVIIGFGIAGSGFGPILAVVGRSASPEKRSLALGITTAAGSAGQVVGLSLIHI